MIYYLGMIGIAAFAITGVIAAGKKGMDIFSIVLLGVVTALGGGTVRDIIINAYPIYWINDLLYLWVAAGASVLAFFAIRLVNQIYKLLIYIDAFGLSLFTILATERCITLGIPEPAAVLMGVTTGVAGGMIRDMFTGRMPLLLGKEFYGTPALMGAVFFVVLTRFFPEHEFNRLYAMAAIFLLRAGGIQWGLYYPSWLTYQKTTD